MDHDAVGNLLTLTERNGDQLVMTYDVLNRLKGTVRKSLDGPEWALMNEFDSRGESNQAAKGGAVDGQEHGSQLRWWFGHFYRAFQCVLPDGFAEGFHGQRDHFRL